MLTLAGLDVLLAAEAIVGMQAKAIAEDRIKVMRRMRTSLLLDQTCWRPQLGQRIGIFMSGRLSNITELVVRPVRIGRFFHRAHDHDLTHVLFSPNCWTKEAAAARPPLKTRSRARACRRGARVPRCAPHSPPAHPRQPRRCRARRPRTWRPRS